MTEAPTGEMEREPESADPAAVRAAEALLARQGRRKYNTVAARRSAATVVAYTDIATTVARARTGLSSGARWCAPTRAATGWAWRSRSPTCVCSPRSAPTSTELTTYNAEVNAHMVGVNDAARVTSRSRRLGEFQKRLAPGARPCRSRTSFAVAESSVSFSRLASARAATGDRHGVTGAVGPDGRHQRVGAGDQRVVDLRDDVAGGEPGLGGGRTAGDLLDLRALGDLGAARCWRRRRPRCPAGRGSASRP